MDAGIRWTVTGLAIALIVSGCLQGSTPTEDDEAATAKGAPFGVDDLGRAKINPRWAEDAVAGSLNEDHDHTVASQHENLSTPNFEVVGWNPLISDWYGTTAAMHLCGTTVETDERRLNAVHAWGTDVAVIISDVTDLADPQKIGELVMENTLVYDVTMTPDQRFVLLGTNPGTAAIGADNGGLDLDVAPQLYWRDACTGQMTRLGPEQGLPFSSGVVLVDIQNPRVPTIVDFRFFPPSGGHSVRAHEIDGNTLILATIAGSPHLATYQVFMQILEPPAGDAKLEILSVYTHAMRDGQTHESAQLEGSHDGYIQKHPVTGDVLAYIAYGPSGLVILDLNDPRNPTLLAQWADFGVAKGKANMEPYMHEALPFSELWDGKHFTVIGEECLGRGEATPTCLIWLLDTTDPASPQFVGAWTLPVDVNWRKSLDYSLHYVAVGNGTLYVSAYHGGMWAIDISTDEARHMMPSIGVFMPTNVSPKPAENPNRLPSYPLDYAPVVLDMDVMSDGTIVLFDAVSGLYTVRFDPSYPAPSPAPWPLGYNE